MTPTTKNALLLVFLAAVCSNASDKWKFDYETGEDNFTKKQRWQTGALNILPGVGSYFIMDDFTGAAIQWGLSGAGVALLGVFSITDGYCWDKYSTNGSITMGTHASDAYDKCDYVVDIFGWTGVALLGSSFIYNIYRSITYNKPQKTAYSENSGFNIAVLPNRNGKLNAFLIYNKAF